MGRARSITSSESFQARLLHAEQWRLGLMTACLAGLLAVWLLRRMLGGVVATTDAAFYPVVTILGLGIAAMVVGFIDATRRRRRGATFPAVRAHASAIIDLAIPLGCLLVLELKSPRGAYAALSGPSLLLIPIVVMLSVLRLRPMFSLGIGIAGAAGHWALASRAMMTAHLDAPTWPVIFSYGLLIALSGAAAAVLAHVVRRYIEEAVSEAQAAEKSERALHALEHELDMARSIQLGLLPTEAPQMPGFDIAGMARPATKAGGDYYDWQPLPDGRLVVAIADVTGHGVAPALVMAVCRAYARATAPTSASASDFLERMNGLIVDDIKGQRFITMAVALVHPRGEIELLSAGHGPTFLYRQATGQVEQFGGNGLPLGIIDDEQFNPTEYLRLDPGDMLVLLTDGFMEQPSAKGEQFGAQRLADVIAQHASRRAKEVIAAIDHAVTEFADGRAQVDDVTAVVLRRQA